jgi:putative toxin-antitoxin system antitoxin component (TIGR02293 family)
VAFGSLERLARLAGLDDAGLARFLGVSIKTLRRRAEKGALDAAESMKTEMLAHALDEARRVLGDEEAARRWLRAPVASLDGRPPIDHLDSIEGYERVRETLTKIEYGMY